MQFCFLKFSDQFCWNFMFSKVTNNLNKPGFLVHSHMYIYAFYKATKGQTLRQRDKTVILQENVKKSVNVSPWKRANKQNKRPIETEQRKLPTTDCFLMQVSQVINFKHTCFKSAVPWRCVPLPATANDMASWSWTSFVLGVVYPPHALHTLIQTVVVVFCCCFSSNAPSAWGRATGV